MALVAKAASMRREGNIVWRTLDAPSTTRMTWWERSAPSYVLLPWPAARADKLMSLAQVHFDEPYHLLMVGGFCLWKDFPTVEQRIIYRALLLRLHQLA